MLVHRQPLLRNLLDSSISPGFDKMMCDSSRAWNAQVRVVSRDGGQNLGPVEPGHVGHLLCVDNNVLIYGYAVTADH